MIWFAAFWFSVLFSGCGGLPGDYSDVLQDAAGEGGWDCSTSGEATIFGIMRIENPGDLSIEIRSVKFVDAVPSSVEFYVMAVPHGQSGLGGSGSTLLSDEFSQLPDLAESWQKRQGVPAEVASGFNAEIVVVLDQSRNPAAVHYVNEFEVVLGVDGHTESASFETLRMAGTSENCEATEADLRGD